MFLLYCDESNLEERDGDFLIYGGLMIDADRAQSLSATVDKIRTGFGVPRDFPLKYNPGPKNLNHQRFIELKQAVIRAAQEHDAKFLCYVILHNIALNADEARRNGINSICFHFDCLLFRKKQTGLVLIDRFNDAGNQIEGHLREKFSIGIKDMPYSKEMRMENIVGFHYSAIGQSHFPSIIDIVLGSLRFSINSLTRKSEAHLESAKTQLKQLAPLFVRDKDGSPVLELSFYFSPKVIKIEKYRNAYLNLKQFLADSGIETAQPITAERQY